MTRYRLTTKRFSKLANDWINSLDKDTLSENTIEQYRTSLKVFLEYLESNKIKKITKEVVISYKEYLQSEQYLSDSQKKKFTVNEYNNRDQLTRKPKTSTINIRLVSLNRIFTKIGYEDLNVKTIKRQRKTHLDNIVTESELQRLYDACKELGKERLALILDVLTGTGIRIEELKDFTAQSVQAEDNIITVTNKGKERDVLLPDIVKQKLIDYINKNKIENVIFHGRNKNKLLDKTTIWRELKKVAEYANVNPDKISAHQFRHLYAKRMVDHIGLETLSDLLGHDSIETTRIYTRKTSKEQLADINNVYNKFNK